MKWPSLSLVLSSVRLSLISREQPLAWEKSITSGLAFSRLLALVTINF